MQKCLKFLSLRFQLVNFVYYFQNHKSMKFITYFYTFLCNKLHNQPNRIGCAPRKEMTLIPLPWIIQGEGDGNYDLIWLNEVYGILNLKNESFYGLSIYL